MSDLFAALIFVTIAACSIYEAHRSRLDPFQPIYYAMLGFAGVYCLQYVAGRERLLSWFGDATMGYAMCLAFMGIALFGAGYYSPLARALALRLPKPMSNWRPGRLAPLALALIGIGVMGQLWFIHRSGGAQTYFSAARGKGAYESNTAYLYGLKWLITPGIIFWAVDCARKKGLARYAWLLVGLPWLLYQVIMGQRSGVFSVGVLLLACAFVPRKSRPPIWMAPTGVMLLLLTVGFLTIFRSEFYAGSHFRGVHQFGRRPVSERLRELTLATYMGAVGRIKWGSELTMYVNYLRIFPDKVSFDYGMEYSQLLVAWVPRLLWPERPDWREPKRAAIFREIGTSHLGGPTCTMLGMYYTHFGMLSLFLGAFLTGSLYGGIARMRDLWPDSMGVDLVFLSFFNCYALSLGNGPVASFRTWGIWTLMPLVLASIYLRFVTPSRKALKAKW